MMETYTGKALILNYYRKYILKWKKNNTTLSEQFQNHIAKS